ncbi:tRNA (guanosine(46)-N7)-methyltransferase TrmB [Boudabousia liubingyangii]|uniref:tRNA (guanosine(46)-N7)-methyltransferase TrmB n=1 Tax=Boudabousia liubingyangii TaxID=1921764 RepID=UPI00093CF22E|nr:tRNA (guanosine(46)-N7)-methyltransferase TrmB [Boudabousia liubingyangii]OKL47466.1 tRNA (guanosine(46)-N7)-methyltransferase TrmB [Boudabousia liubingyangii]
MSTRAYGSHDIIDLKGEQLPDGRFRARTKSFVRRGTRMAASLENTWQEHGPKYLIEVPRAIGHTSVDPNITLDFKEVFGNDHPVILEVGMGAGDQIVNAAKNHPENNYLGLEVWRPGAAKTISKAANAQLENLRILEADAVQVLQTLVPAECLAEVWTFFPDPWRKARHHKRRIVQVEFAQLVAKALVPGGIWRLATDWDDYAWHMRDVLAQTPELVNLYEGANPREDDPAGPTVGGFAPRWEERVLTRFENRGRKAGRIIMDFQAQKPLTEVNH